MIIIVIKDYSIFVVTVVLSHGTQHCHGFKSEGPGEKLLGAHGNTAPFGGQKQYSQENKIVVVLQIDVL